MSDSGRLAHIRSTLADHGQAHLLGPWNELDDGQRSRLLDDIEQIDFAGWDELVANHLQPAAPFPLPSEIDPAPVYPADPGIDLVGKYADGVKRGVSMIRQNKVAALTLADDPAPYPQRGGPVGARPVSPIKHKSIFQLFAEFIQATNRRHGADLTWLIMTNPVSDAATRSHFAEHNHFGLRPDRIRFLEQGVLPVCSTEGKILLDDQRRVAFAPVGRGGCLAALRRSGALKEIADAGVELISTFPSNNPIARPIDPLFVGLHVLTGSQISSKTIPRTDHDEQPGHFVRSGGRTLVIPCAEFPDQLAQQKEADGQRRFDAADIGSHILDRSFVEDLTDAEGSIRLPWRREMKTAPHVEEKGARIEPSHPNTVRLAMFLFDAIPLAGKDLILQTTPAEEFSPVPPAGRAASGERARRDLNQRAADWLHRAGFDVPRKPNGEPDGRFEISPLLALDGAHLREVMVDPPKITPGRDHYWE